MKELAKLKFRVTKAWENTETENAIHYEWHTFHFFCTLARPVAFINAWLDIEIPVTPCFLCHAGEKFIASHTANSTLELKMSCQLNVDAL